jgi:hypothetical protein
MDIDHAVTSLSVSRSVRRQTLPQVLHEVMLELQVVKILDHPSITQFLGAASAFPGARDPQKDWSVGLVFEL